MRRERSRRVIDVSAWRLERNRNVGERLSVPVPDHEASVRFLDGPLRGVVLRTQFNRAIATDLERSNRNARHAAGGGRGGVLHRPPALMPSRGAE